MTMHTYSPSKSVSHMSQLGCILQLVKERVRVAQLWPHSQPPLLRAWEQGYLIVCSSTLKSPITILMLICC